MAPSLPAADRRRAGRPAQPTIARPSARDRIEIDALVAIASPEAFRVSPDGRAVACLEEIAGARQVCLRPLRGGTRRQLTASPVDLADPQWSPDGSRLAYVREGSIWVMDADGGRALRVADHPAGESSPRWAPDGVRLAFLSRRRGWSQLWIADVPRPGRGRPRSVERMPEARRLSDEPWDLEHPVWSSDGRWLLAGTTCLPDLATEQLVLIDPDGARPARIIAGHDSLAQGGSWWPDGRSIVYLDDRDGWLQVRRRRIDPRTGEPGDDVALTEGPADHGPATGEPTTAPHVSPDGSRVAFLRLHDGLSDLMVGLVPDDGQGPLRQAVRIDPEPGLWRIIGWVGSDQVAAIGETTTRPQDLWLLPVPGLAGRRARPSQVTDSLPGAVPVHRFVAPEPVTFAARDGLSISAQLWRPADADGSPGGRRVPVLIEAHGGPTSQRYASWWPFPQVLVQEGMAVLSVDYRGSSGYGRSFRLANVGEWGHADTFDLIDAARWAREQPWADGRSGVHGGSYGGYMTLTCLVEEPSLWKVGVDLFGDSEIAESYRHGDRVGRLDLERMMGRPDDPATAEAYRRGSPVYRAERIEAPLLILHGRQDARVVPLMTERMVEALRIEGKFHEVHWYDDEGHGWRRRENRRDAFRRELAFLKRHLLGQVPPGSAGSEGTSAGT